MLAIAGGKGGSGKTTTTLGLAAALPGIPTAIDADWDLPNLHALAGVDREPSILDLGSQDDPVDLSCFPRSIPNVASGVPSRDLWSRPESAFRIVPAPDAEFDRKPLSLLSAAVAKSEPPVLFDCPAGAGPDATAPLRVASGTLLVTTPTPAALRDTVKTAAMARALEADPVGVVLTRCRREPRDVGGGRLFDCPVLGTVPPVSDYPLSCRSIADAYRDIAAELAGSCQ